MKILLDTNFLLYCAKHRIGYEASGELFVLRAVIGELKNLKKTAKKEEDRKSASLALEIIEKGIREGEIEEIEETGKADDLIVVHANEFGAVATMDRELKEKLKGKTRIMTIRGKKKIEII
jgi:rRNA-processing protein FCF1